MVFHLAVSTSYLVILNVDPKLKQIYHLFSLPFANNYSDPEILDQSFSGILICSSLII